MSFPITAECYLSSSKLAHEQEGMLFLYPLELVIYVNRQKNVIPLYKITLFSSSSKDRTGRQCINISTGSRDYEIAAKQEIDQRTLAEMLQRLIPKTGFKDSYIVDMKVDWLSTEEVSAFYGRNSETHGLYLLRTFSTLRSLKEVELIHLINHRCCLKPHETYIQGEEIILVYDYISAKCFRQTASKISRIETEDLSKFLTKVLFFCFHLEELKIFIPDLQDRFFLENGHLSEPFIIDLSKAYALTQNESADNNSISSQIQALSMNPILHDYAIEIGKMLYRIIFKCAFDQDNILRFREEVGELKSINPKLLDLLLKLLHVDGKAYNIREAMLHPWFRQIKFTNMSKLRTIPSLNLTTQQTKQLYTMSSQSENDQDEGNILANFMAKHVSHIKTPFSFKHGPSQTTLE